MFTAIVQSKAPVGLSLPGVTVLNTVQTFRHPEDRLDACLGALEQVTTPWCFFLDDDDEMPPDYLDVLAECAAADMPLAYTNEVMRWQGADTTRRSGPYSQAAHMSRPLMVHHLALLRTADARRASASLPRGRYWPEMLLFWQLAKGGAHWVDRVGYIWNRGDGLSSQPKTIEAQVNSLIWCEKDMAR